MNPSAPPYVDRNWPPALKDSGAWPLASLRRSFLNGSLTRLLDPDTILRTKVVEFVGRGDFGLASGQKGDGTYERVWFQELTAPDAVCFELGFFLLTKHKAQALKAGIQLRPASGPTPQPAPRLIRVRHPSPVRSLDRVLKGGRSGLLVPSRPKYGIAWGQRFFRS